MQRTALIAATALGVVFAHGATAADLPVAPAYRPAPIVVPYNWNGYYLGANVGWSRAESNITWSPNPFGFVDAAAIAAASNNRLTSNSATGGVQTGYNWQWGNVVAGIEGDVSFMGNNANVSVAPLPPPAFATTSLSESARLNWLVTVRPRLGYAWDNWLVYVTGGWALGKVTFSDALQASAVTFVGNNVSKDLNGWTAGAGVEYGVGGGWTLKAEYLYTDLGSVAVSMGPTSPSFPGTLVGTNHSMINQIARVGFNYRFGGTSEVVVRYP
jgi:outer membrane immunogenic protein